MKSQKIHLPKITIRKGDTMQTPEAVAAMRRLYELGWGLRRIAGELGCSRNTVKGHLGDGGWRPYRSPERRRTLGALGEWLAASFRQHRGNADVVRQELQRVHGLRVSLRTVERAVRPWRRELEAEARATVRFETPPGRQLQIDFGTTTVRIGEAPMPVRLFVATLGFSRRAFVAVFDHERQAAWLTGLEGAFRHFGGVPEEVLLDNARALVDAHDPTTRVVAFNARFLAFARYWGFNPGPAPPTGRVPKARTNAESVMSSATPLPGALLPPGRRWKATSTPGGGRWRMSGFMARPARRRWNDFGGLRPPPCNRSRTVRPFIGPANSPVGFTPIVVSRWTPTTTACPGG